KNGNGIYRVLRPVAPACGFEDIVIHGLDPQLHQGHAVFAEKFRLPCIDRIRPGGKPDGRDRPGPKERLQRLQQGALLTFVKERERPPVESDFHRWGSGRDQPFSYCGDDFIGSGKRTGYPGDRLLVAEQALVGASPVRNEKGDDDALQGFMAASASRAAACCASFLLLPEPDPAGTPSRSTETVYTFSWSGPSTPVSSYFGAGADRDWISS